MSETMLQWINFLELIAVSCYATLYGFGGIRGKWKRRYVGSVLFTISVALFSLWLGKFNWISLAVLPLLIGATSIGYGADKTMEKILKRAYCGLAYSCASLPIFVVNGKWIVFALHIALCVITSIVLGVTNPYKNARAEETTIGFFIAFLPLMSL